MEGNPRPGELDNEPTGGSSETQDTAAGSVEQVTLQGHQQAALAGDPMPVSPGVPVSPAGDATAEAADVEEAQSDEELWLEDAGFSTSADLGDSLTSRARQMRSVLVKLCILYGEENFLELCATATQTNELDKALAELYASSAGEEETAEVEAGTALTG